MQHIPALDLCHRNAQLGPRVLIKVRDDEQELCFLPFLIASAQTGLAAGDGAAPGPENCLQAVICKGDL